MSQGDGGTVLSCVRRRCRNVMWGETGTRTPSDSWPTRELIMSPRRVWCIGERPINRGIKPRNFLSYMMCRGRLIGPVPAYSVSRWCAARLWRWVQYHDLVIHVYRLRALPNQLESCVQPGNPGTSRVCLCSGSPISSYKSTVDAGYY